MLSGLTFGDRAALEQEHLAEAKTRKAKKQQHKKDKAKKHKKERKHKRKGAQSSDSSFSSGSEGRRQQLSPSSSPIVADGGADRDNGDAAAASSKPQLQREDWMTVPMARSQVFDQQPQKPEPAPQSKEAPVVAGIRYMDPKQAAAAAAKAAAREGQEAGAVAGGGGTAAGVSWRVRALQRAQQLAKEQGKDLNEVLSERWGSAADIAKGIITGAAEQPGSHRATSSGREPGHAGGSRAAGRSSGLTPHYLSDVRSERAAMKPPSSIASGGNNLSWRRSAGSARSGAAGRDARTGKGTEQQSWDKGRSYAGRERDRQAEEIHDRQEGDKDRNNTHAEDMSREDRQQQLDRSRDRDRYMGSSRHMPGRGIGRHLGHDKEGNRDIGWHFGRDDRHNSSTGRQVDRSQLEQLNGSQQPQQRCQRPLESRQHRQADQQQQRVVEALKAVAGSINTFKNDGSFMRQLQQQQQQQESPDEQQNGQQALQSLADRTGKPAVNSIAQDDADDGAEASDAAPVQSLATPNAAADNNCSRTEMLRSRLAGLKKAPAEGSAAAATAASSTTADVAAGNKSVAEALRARLACRAAAAPAAAADTNAADGKQHEVVMLPQVDAAGCPMPGAFGRESAGEARRAEEAAAGGRISKRVQRYSADGTKERYFADDDATDLQTLVKRAKYGDDNMNIDRSLMRNIAAKSRFKETDLDADAEYDYDAGLDMSESHRKRGDVQQQRAREHQRQVAQFNRIQRLEHSCTFCFSSPARSKELLIAVGQATYLSLVPRGRLVEGHCCIVPAEHMASMRQVDDAIWTEVRNFQKCLIQMFMTAGKEVLFLETATNLTAHKHHAVMEVIPVGQEAFAKSPMYFKKALQEAESDWSQHAAKAVIETKSKGLRGSIPPNFPYMYVQFGYGNGFVHVIDDERKFNKDLGRQVIVGLLKLPAEVMHRKQRVDAAAVQASMAAQFRKQFAPYDWTKALD